MPMNNYTYHDSSLSDSSDSDALFSTTSSASMPAFVNQSFYTSPEPATTTYYNTNTQASPPYWQAPPLQMPHQQPTHIRNQQPWYEPAIVGQPSASLHDTAPALPPHTNGLLPGQEEETDEVIPTAIVMKNIPFAISREQVMSIMVSSPLSYNNARAK